MWESFLKNAKDFRLRKGKFLSNFTEKTANLSYLCVRVIAIHVFLNLLQVFILEADQTLANTDRFSVQVKCLMTVSLCNRDIAFLQRLFARVKRK